MAIQADVDDTAVLKKEVKLSVGSQSRSMCLIIVVFKELFLHVSCRLRQ